MNQNFQPQPKRAEVDMPGKVLALDGGRNAFATRILNKQTCLACLQRWACILLPLQTRTRLLSSEGLSACKLYSIQR